MSAHARCKGKFAYSVKLITSLSFSDAGRLFLRSGFSCRRSPGETVCDPIGSSIWIIIRLTLLWTFFGRIRSEHPRQPRQADDPAPARRAQSTPSRGGARVVPGRPILRPPRFAAGEVRDAALGACGQAPNQRGSPGLRPFASIVLSGTERLRARWLGWPAAPQARPPRRSQAHPAGTRIRRLGARCQSTAACRTAGQFGARAVWPSGTPPQHRQATRWQKKRR